MSTSITIELPEAVLIEALQKLSPERRRQLLEQANEETKIQLVPFPMETLKEITGIISVGGDALI